MAIVNFTNLATARASQRAREVALRKVLGATRRQLIVQFIGESILIAAVSMLLALALVELLVPAVRRLPRCRSRAQLFRLRRHPAAGDRPGPAGRHRRAASTPPSSCRASSRRRCSRPTIGGGTPGSGRLRNILVVGQFAVSIGLIICTAVIYGQTVYARSVDPGYKRDHILQVDDLCRAPAAGARPDHRRADQARSRRRRRRPAPTSASRPTTTTTPA